MKRQPWIDWIRFTASFLVVFFHVRQYLFYDFVELTPIKLLFIGITRLGQDAVIIFFSLSGYLVAGNALYRLNKSEFILQSYLIDRFVRIYLPLIPALGFTAICGFITGKHYSIYELSVNLVGLQGIYGYQFMGNAPLWTLSYEIWFYILLGVVCAFANTNNRNYFNILFISPLIIISFSVFTVLSCTMLFCWIIGGIFFFDKRFCVFKLFIYFAFLLIALIISALKNNLTLFVSIEFTKIFLAFAFSGVLSQIVHLNPSSNFLLKIERFGTIPASFSYTLYLTHYPLIQLWFYYFPNRYSELDCFTISYFIFLCFVCLIFSYFMFLLFEKHTSTVKRLLAFWLNKIFTRVPNIVPTRFQDPCGRSQKSL